MKAIVVTDQAAGTAGMKLAQVAQFQEYFVDFLEFWRPDPAFSQEIV